MKVPRLLLSLAGLAALLSLWATAVALGRAVLLPGPWKVLRGLTDLAVRGTLARHVVASLFRVTWGYAAAVMAAVPLGVALGWSRAGRRALDPLLQILRPISPLAWIPIAILWFGVGDASAIFIIFLASFFQLTVSTMQAVAAVPMVYLQAGSNFGLSTRVLLTRVVFPAAAPQLIVGLRLSLGVAWLVVVAAEMIAVNSGLGFLIVDARNAGDRYDLVIGGMLIIGAIGLGLDTAMRALERLPSLRWGHAGASS